MRQKADMFNSDDFKKIGSLLGITSFGGITNHHIECGNMGFDDRVPAAVRAPKGTVFAQYRATPDHVGSRKSASARMPKAIGV